MGYKCVIYVLPLINRVIKKHRAENRQMPDHRTQKSSLQYTTVVTTIHCSEGLNKEGVKQRKKLTCKV